MIITNSNYWPKADIEVSLYKSASTEPFLVQFALGTTIHLSLSEAERLHTQLTAAMYEYDTEYPYKEAS